MFEPIITVLMPVHNGSLYLCDAIDSILGQTYHNFEFLIIDDGSTDNTADIISSYKDGRIRVIKNDTNIGISKALNIGIQNARGRYIARMDCDDVSRSDRLYKQVLFMEQHPEIGVCGSWVKTIEEWGQGNLWRFYTEPEQIKCQLLFGNVLAHPSVLIRRDVLKTTGTYYHVLYKYAQDYKLWVELAKKVLFVNIPEVLVAYRIHDKQASVRHADEAISEPDRIKLEQLAILGIRPTIEEMEIHRELNNGNLVVEKNFSQKAASWLSKLERANEVVDYYPKSAFIQIINFYRNSIQMDRG
ncbi:MAG: glycosyl transferase family 2 [Pelosinus sp.]|jgi:glycosyltransferase involved in cell wall biosynthesis|nr:glycosyl transferase family 2 [Pelosinus sp.]